jgi:hypothetical protein
VDAVLADCEGLRYAGGSAASGDSLHERARRCILDLEHEHL